MSIVIDTDLTQIIRQLNISDFKMKECYKNSSLEEIVEKEAEDGNQAAVAFAYELFKSPDMLVKIFKLASPENKIAFLKEMNTEQLKEFLPLLEEEDLNEGLKFFDLDKLMEMMKELPPDQLVKAVFEMFSQIEIIKYLPEEELDKFLTESDIDKNVIMKNLKMIPQEYLAQMYEAVSGEEADDIGSRGLIENLESLDYLKFQDALRAMQPVAKRQLTLSIASEDEKYFERFSADAYTNMIKTYKFQPEVVKSLEVIEPEEKIKMLEKLPDDLMSIVITQIDAKVFADKIIEKYPELLAKAIIQ